MKPRLGPAAALLAVLAITVAPYVRTLRFGFTLDDANTILGHRGVQEALSFDDIVLRDAWGRSRFDTIGTWRPFATLTFWIDRHVGGGSAFPFHLMNVILYAAFVALADRFLATWCPTLSRGARRLALAAFGALAIHAAVVPNPTGRADILAALFSLGAIAMTTCARDLGAGRIALAATALLLAMASKESAAPMAILVPLLAYRARVDRGQAARGPVIALATACACVLAFIAGFRAVKMPFMSLGPERALENPLLAVDTPHRLLGALDVLGLYARHFATGSDLGPDYSFSEPPLLRDGAAGIVLGAAITLGAAALVVACWKRRPRLADAALAFGASYVAVSNVLLAASAIADRLFFFPSFWLVVVLAMALDGVVRAPAARVAAAAMTIAFTLVQTRAAFAYASEWRDDLTLLGAEVRARPNVFRTQRNLAHALADAGLHDDAAFHLVAAEAIYAHYPAPVARDAIAPAWDGEPLAARLAHLRDSFGASATCAAADVAAKRMRSWDDVRAADTIDAWSHAQCAP